MYPCGELDIFSSPKMEVTEQESPLLVHPKSEQLTANDSRAHSNDSLSTWTLRRVSIMRLIVSILLVFILMDQDWPACFRNSHETYAYCSASQSSSDIDPIKCISNQCAFGGKCSLDAVVHFEKSSTGIHETIINSTSGTCMFWEDDYASNSGGTLTPSSAFCSAATTNGCTCNFWIFVAAVIVGTQALQLIVTHAFFLESLVVSLQRVCGNDDHSGQVEVPLIELICRPVFGAAVFPLVIYALTSTIVFLYYDVGFFRGVVYCGPYKVDEEWDYEGLGGPRSTVTNLIVGTLLFPLLDIYLLSNVSQFLSRLERGETAHALAACFRIDHSLKMTILIFMQSASFGVHLACAPLFLQWSCVDDSPHQQLRDGDEEETATTFVIAVAGPQDKINQQEGSSEGVTATTITAFAPNPTMVADTGTNRFGGKQLTPNSAIRTSFLVSLLKIGVSIGLVMLLNPDWKFCFKGSHEIGRECSAEVDQTLPANRNFTVLCGLDGSPFGRSCNVSGTSVYADPNTSNVVFSVDSCGGKFIGMTGQGLLSSSCSAAFSNEAICSWWIVLTGTVVGLNVLHFLIQVWYTCRGEIDPQKDMFNVIYYGNDRGGVQANGRFLFNRRNCFLSGMEVGYLATVAILFSFADIGIWAAEPGCFVGVFDQYGIYSAVKYQYDIVSLIFNPLSFVFKEVYKLNMFISIQAFRAGKGWSDIIIPLLRLDKSVLYFVLMFSQGVIFGWHVSLPCLCFWWKDKPTVDFE